MNDHGHYWAQQPGVEERHREFTVTLAGRPVRIRTAAGVYSASRLDPGTAVLLRRVPSPPPHGDLLDLGCGWGPVALTQALLAPLATTWAVDVNERALELVRHNASELAGHDASGAARVRAVRPQDVPAAVRFAAIWSNPPVRIGKDSLRHLLLRWLPRLDDGASAHVVVQRHLGADSLHRWLDQQLAPSGYEVARAASANGFRVLRVTRPGTPVG
ncbi:MAG: class I SAM-dependent methyltransferase [Angustibacter sp.]